MSSMLDLVKIRCLAYLWVLNNGFGHDEGDAKQVRPKSGSECIYMHSRGTGLLQKLGELGLLFFILSVF